jgi:flagellar protein FliJ
MRFSFTLQTLLNWKKNLEEMSQERLGEKMNRLKKQEEEMQRIHQRRLAYEKELKEKSLQGIQAGEYYLYKQFAEDSQKDLLRKEEKRQETIRTITLERENLIALSKARKILERLKEKKLKSYVYQMDKLEQKTVDEGVILKHSIPSRKKLPK